MEQMVKKLIKLNSRMANFPETTIGWLKVYIVEIVSKFIEVE